MTVETSLDWSFQDICEWPSVHETAKIQSKVLSDTICPGLNSNRCSHCHRARKSGSGRLECLLEVGELDS